MPCSSRKEDGFATIVWGGLGPFETTCCVVPQEERAGHLPHGLPQERVRGAKPGLRAGRDETEPRPPGRRQPRCQVRSMNVVSTRPSMKRELVKISRCSGIVV